MAGTAGVRGVRDEVQRIGATGVFGARGVVEVGHAGFIKDDVLEHGAEALGGRVDFRLGFGRQADGLGVAAAFEVENAVFAPTMLVVADQRALRVGRKRGLTGTGKAEEDGRVTLRADIGRAVHRHDTLGRQHVIECREDRLLHFAGVGRAADQNDAVGEVAGDDRFRTAAVAGRIGAEARQVDDGQLGLEVVKRRTLRTDQQVTDEQRMPGKLGDDTGRQLVLGIGATDQVLDEQVPAGRMGQHILVQDAEMLGRHGLVVVPPDFAIGMNVADDELVLGRTPGVLAGHGAERTIGGQHGLVA